FPLAEVVGQGDVTGRTHECQSLFLRTPIRLCEELAPPVHERGVVERRDSGRVRTLFPAAEESSPSERPIARVIGSARNNERRINGDAVRSCLAFRLPPAA